MHKTIPGLTFTLLILAACGIKSGGDAEPTSTGEGASTDETLGHSSAPTGEAPTGEPPTGEPPTGETTTTTSTSTATDTGAAEESATSFESSTGDVGTPCALMCQQAHECDPDRDPVACTAICEGDLGEAGPACAAATETMLACFTVLTCEHLALALDGKLDHFCGPQQLDRIDACTDGSDSCDSGGGGSMDGSSCEVEIQCPGDPLRKMTCDTEQCLCFEAGVEVGACAADSACNSLQGLGAKALSCCGFPDPGA